MLKMTEIKSKLISDIDNYYFLETGLRGGISYVSKRFSEANTKYMIKIMLLQKKVNTS